MKKLILILSFLPFTALAQSDSCYLKQIDASVIVVDMYERPIKDTRPHLELHPCMETGRFEIIDTLPADYDKLIFVKPEED